MNNHSLRAIKLASRISDIMLNERYYNTDQAQLLFDRLSETLIHLSGRELDELEVFRLEPFSDIAPPSEDIK